MAVEYIDHASCTATKNIDLDVNDIIYSLDGTVQFGLDNQGQLILQTYIANNWENQWSNNKSPGAHAVLAIQTDGNLVVYENGNAVWAAISNNIYSPHHLVVSNNGYAYMLNSRNTVTWSTSGVTSGLPTFAAPTTSPTYVPSINPTVSSNFPTINPTNPTNYPSRNPSNYPTIFPTNYPTIFPTNYPTIFPTINPTNPSNYPTIFPTNYPSRNPSNKPTIFPTNYPTKNPINPSNYQTITPSNTPTSESSISYENKVNKHTTTMMWNHSHANNSDSTENNNTYVIIGIIILSALVVVVIIFVCCILMKRRRLKAMVDDTNINIVNGNDDILHMDSDDMISVVNETYDGYNSELDIISGVNKTYDGLSQPTESTGSPGGTTRGGCSENEVVDSIVDFIEQTMEHDTVMDPVFDKDMGHKQTIGEIDQQ